MNGKITGLVSCFFIFTIYFETSYSKSFSKQQRPIVSSKIKRLCLTIIAQISFSVGNVIAPTFAKQQGILTPESWNTLKGKSTDSEVSHHQHPPQKNNFSIIMSSKGTKITEALILSHQNKITLLNNFTKSYPLLFFPSL